jgi:xanthine dehydrogenase YagS FAD-binding subunit
MLPNFSYVRPATLNDAVKQLASPGARIHAGGSDLLGCLRDGVFAAEKVVSLSRIESLRGINASSAGGLRVGALTPVADVAASALVKERFSALAEAAAAVASPQLRNQGTLGGNICQRPRCWYFRGDFHCIRKGGDTCFAMAGENQYHCIFGGSACLIVHPSDTAPALVALNAEARIVGPAGERVAPLERFFVLPSVNVTKENILEANEIVTDIIIPAPPAGLRSGYRKVRGRSSWDFALTSLATAVVVNNGRVEHARFVLGGVAPVPWRLEAVEKAITGRRLDAKLVAQAAEAAVNGAEPLAKNGYKVALVRGAVTEVLTGLVEPAAQRKREDPEDRE